VEKRLQADVAVVPLTGTRSAGKVLPIFVIIVTCYRNGKVCKTSSFMKLKRFVQ